MKSTKVVNIYPSMPITGVNPPIRSAVKRVTKSIQEIRTCLMSRAVVEEILSDGSTVRLNIGNYDKCLDENHVCGCGCCSCESETPVNNTNEKSDWDKAYENALEGVDLSTMSRKQRRAAIASAKAAADAAVGEKQVVIEDGLVDDAHDSHVEGESVSVDVTEEPETVVEETVEEVVVTDDVEALEEVAEVVESTEEVANETVSESNDAE